MKKLSRGIPVVLLALLMASCNEQNSQSNSQHSASVPNSTSVSMPTSISGSASTSSSGSTSTSVSASTSTSTSTSTSVSDNPIIEGDGTLENPYVASNPTQLRGILNSCRGETMQYVVLSKDIELRNEWAPIGDANSPVNAYIDGQGHSIKNLSITHGNSDVSFYGLIGCFVGVACNLTIEGNIDFAPQNATNGIGLFAGATVNSYLYGVKAKGTINIKNNTEIESLAVNIGGVVGFNALDQYSSTVFEELAFEGDITCGVKNAILGGILGASANTMSVLPITNSYVKAGQIKGGYVVGGITGSTAFYSSVTNCVVNAENIETIDDEGSYAGGISGTGYYETAFLNNIVNVDTITAPVSTSTYKSSSGDVVGLAYEDGYEEYINILGAGIANNVSLKTTTVSADNVAKQTEVVTLNNDVVEDLGFARAFNLENNELVMKDLIDISEDDFAVTVHKNDGSNEVENPLVSPNSLTDVGTTFARDGFLNHGLYYDEAATVAYRFYAPINGNIDFYCGWFDTSRLSGHYQGTQAANGVIQFLDDGTLVWAMTDLYSSEGTWWCNGEYIIFSHLFADETVCVWDEANNSLTFLDANSGEYYYTFNKCGEIYGYYDGDEGRRLFLNDNGTGTYSDGSTVVNITFTTNGNVLTVGSFANFASGTITINNDKSLQFAVTDDDGYSYTWNFVEGSATPNYSGKAMVKSYRGNFEGRVDLLPNGNFEYYKTSEDSVYCYGGFRVDYNTLTMKSDSAYIFNGTFKYDASTETLTKSDGSVLMAASGTHVKSVHTSDNSVWIHVFDNKTYVVINGSLNKTATVTGTITDGETIQIGSDSYTVSGETITYVSPEPDKTPLVNEYIDETHNISLVLNADGTGTYDGNAFTYTWDGTNVKFNVNSCDVDLVFDATNKTLTGTYDDGEYPVSVSFVVKPEGPVEEKNVIGTWTGEGLGGNTYTIVIASDNTYALTTSADTTFTGTWTGDVNGTITLDCTSMEYTIYNSLSIAYQASSDTLSLTFDDYDDMPGSSTGWTRVE